jgi:hypothetical protein
MPELNENTLNLLHSMDDLCGVMIDEAKENPTEINQLRICEVNNLRAIIQGAISMGHEASPEELEAELKDLGRRVRALHQNPVSVGKHDHMLEVLKKGKGV